MPFPEIQLDDRKFEELFQEAKRRIPAYNPSGPTTTKRIPASRCCSCSPGCRRW